MSSGASKPLTSRFVPTDDSYSDDSYPTRKIRTQQIKSFRTNPVIKLLCIKQYVVHVKYCVRQSPL